MTGRESMDAPGSGGWQRLATTLWSLVFMSAVLVCSSRETMPQDFMLITLDPGHFHAALFQRDMLPGFADEVFVYAPLGPDLTAHLNRVAQFNLRENHPTRWRLNVYAAPDYLERMLRKPPGQVVMMSGRNRGKLERILACVRAGLHVLADKPWIIEPEDLPMLETTLNEAAARKVTVYDAMTQRYEITVKLQRALVQDPEIFGRPLCGTALEPSVTISSLHYLLKEVSGVPNLRPAWFFDTHEQGEGLSDVGTHLVDMVQWILFPEEAIDYCREIQLLEATRWPTFLSSAQFEKITAQKAFPVFLRANLKADRLQYDCNNAVTYRLRGIHVRLETTWDFAATAGGQDTEMAVFRGTKARVEMRQGIAESFRREVGLIPNETTDRVSFLTAIKHRVTAWQDNWPGIDVSEEKGRFRIIIPDQFRGGHEEHFALVATQFLDYARKPSELPPWEKSTMMAKYYVTTRGVQLARQAQAGH